MITSSKPAVTLTLAVVRSDRTVRRHTTARDIVKIGRDARSHLRIDDELAARMHAVLEVASPSDITLIDLGAAAGTLVNGERVHKSPVRPGDRIQIGSTVIVVERADPTMPTLTDAPVESPTEDEGERFTYAMVKSGPDVSPDEVEIARLPAIEVTVLWDRNVLHVSHLSPPRAFYVGEERAGKASCDYFIPSNALGDVRAPIVLTRGPCVVLIILPRSSGYVDVPGHGRVSLADLVSTGRATPSTEARGGHEYDLPRGGRARMKLDGSALAFEIGLVNAGRPLPGGFLATMEPESFRYAALSLLAHVGLLATFAFFLPNLRGDDAEDVDRDRILIVHKLLDAAASREIEERSSQPALETPDHREGGTGTRPGGEEGSMGDPSTRDTAHRAGVQGPRDSPDPHLARQAALQEAAQFGMIGLMRAIAGGDPNAPTIPWGHEESAGRDDKSARGTLFGDTIGDVLGGGGLGLSGVGESGGGPGDGIGMSSLGGMGQGRGNGPGQGIGTGGGRLPQVHEVRAPRIREGNPQVAGHLPAAVIQRIVRQNFGRFRFCYENGVRANSDLQGRVTVRFVIDRSGAVAMTADGGSDLPDRSVVQCVVRAFGNLSFPEPEGGLVTVVYPIVLHPGD
ncbi:MAG TPA: AgmX/PglI C-terminal domain-containing protein [Polyangiaceae bacterium]|nr:AgmX/PglI C-terminal domain-containing protein [Polyangiaceae bacterium]